jgi:hypothetical protein
MPVLLGSNKLLAFEHVFGYPALVRRLAKRLARCFE